jgi:hypothetical protein
MPIVARAHEPTALGDEHFNNLAVIKHLSYLHDKYVVAPAYKAPNNICVTLCDLTLHRLLDKGIRYR